MIEVAGHWLSIPGVLALGVAAGWVAGMFGVGGGFVLTPLLNLVFGVPVPIAVGTGLCQMVGTALVSLLRHRSVGQGEIRFDLTMLGGSLLGVDAGARAVAALAARGSVSIGNRPIPLINLIIEATYIVLLSSASLLFWRQGGGGVSARRGWLARVQFGPAIELPVVGLRVSAIVVAYLGLALGFLSGLLGVGGGVALMPVLVYGFGFPIRQAAGTGILLIVCTAAFGTFVHALHGHVHLELAMLLLVGAGISAQLGALATHRLAPARLRRGFALVVLATAVAIAWDLSRKII